MPAPSKWSLGTATILRSYADFDIANIGPAHYLRYLLESRWIARKVYNNISSPEDVLALSIDGIEYGDLIYDAVLQDGYATMSSVDEHVLRKLQDFFLQRALIRHVLDRYSISSIYVTHLITLRYGALVRYALHRNICVVLCRCVEMLNLIKLNSLDDLAAYSLRPDERYLNHMLYGERERVLSHGDRYLEKRFDRSFEQWDISLAFNPGNRTFQNRIDFATQFRLDPDKRNVFVMLHAFNDHPHVYGRHSLLYRDYFEWFARTLEVARSTSSVNWIFKEHPAAAFYPTRDLSLEDVFGGVEEDHVAFIGRDSDFNARSLKYLADVIVTCVGTAGLEYSAVGIPCILGGDGPFSGYGFTYDSKSASEYEERLQNIHATPPLAPDQLDLAKIIMYYELRMAYNTPFYVAPEYGDYQAIRELDPERFWEDAARWMGDMDQEKANREIEKLAFFFRTSTFVQYLDFDLHDYMRSAIDPEEARECDEDMSKTRFVLDCPSPDRE